MSDPQSGDGASRITPSSSERILDAAIECTFPASDPVSVQHAFKTAWALEQDRERQAAEGGSALRDRTKRRRMPDDGLTVLQCLVDARRAGS
jgi:hypothetical protein